MKPFFLLLFVFFTASLALAQKAQFVCTPCGSSCDRELHDGPGNCQSCGMTLIEKSSITFSEVTFEQLCERMKSNPKIILLDVRSAGEFNGTLPDAPTYGHFKNAININITELENRMDELTKYKDSEILVYCSHSHRSPRASYLLSTGGFRNVKNVAGGVSVLTPDLDCLKSHFVPHAR